jgi:hypothetical protein
MDEKHLHLHARSYRWDKVSGKYSQKTEYRVKGSINSTGAHSQKLSSSIITDNQAGNCQEIPNV